MFGSMYGLGVLNDTIVPGYNTTKFPVNLNTFWALPNGTTRNFGEATQYVTYPTGYPSFMYQLAQNFMSPNHISQWNPMLIGTGINLMNNCGTNPYLTEAGQISAYNWGANMATQMLVSQSIQTIANALNSLESGLSNALNSDKLTKAQKAELKGLLEEVKALKEKIEKQLKDKNPTIKETTAMQKEVQNLQKKVSDTIKKINGQINNSESSQASQTSSSSSASDAEDTDEANEDTTAKKQHEEKLKSMKDVCMYLDKAMSGCGTNYDDNEYGMYKILSNPALVNEDYIVELFEQWENSYAKVGDYADDADGFIETLMDECEGSQKEEVASLIVTLLEKRADKLGIDVSSEAAAARSAMKSNWIGWRDDDAIQRTVNALYNKVKQANDKHIEKTDKKAATKKAEAKKKIEQRKKETINEKKNEIAKKLKEALKLKETPALAAGLKVETDDNGEFTGYSIEINTNNGKVKVTGVTYQELALAIEAQGLAVEDVLIRKTQA